MSTRVDIQEPKKQGPSSWEEVLRETASGCLDKPFIAEMNGYRGVCFMHNGLFMLMNGGIRHWDRGHMLTHSELFKFERWTTVTVEAA